MGAGRYARPGPWQLLSLLALGIIVYSGSRLADSHGGGGDISDGSNSDKGDGVGGGGSNAISTSIVAPVRGDGHRAAPKLAALAAADVTSPGTGAAATIAPRGNSTRVCFAVQEAPGMGGLSNAFAFQNAWLEWAVEAEVRLSSMLWPPPGRNIPQLA